MKQEIIEKTYELVDEIKGSEDYKKLQKLHKIIDTNSEIKELINIFKKYNDKYEEVSKYGKYHPDLKKVQKQFSEAKTNLYSNKLVKEYKELENRIQKILDNISKELAIGVSKKIKHPNELGLINKH